MDSDRARKLLAQERERIEKAIAALGPEPEAADDDEPGDRDSEELYQQEHDAGREEELQRQLAELERAEARLADGVYGLSIDSGEPIPDERLEALPTAERTIEEQEAAGPQ
jgi:DnaK suppressor protein